jgi:hypothetical protein
MPSYRTISLSKFWDNIALDDSGCWIWQGVRNEQGYGRLGSMFAHRLAWELEHDESIPSGKVICHRCDNPSCVNPSHLFLGNQQDNVKDRQRKGRSTIQVPSLDALVIQLDSMRRLGASPEQIEQRAIELLGIEPDALRGLRDAWDEHNPEWPQGGVKFTIGKLRSGGRFMPVDKGPLNELEF